MAVRRVKPDGAKYSLFDTFPEGRYCHLGRCIAVGGGSDYANTFPKPVSGTLYLRCFIRRQFGRCPPDDAWGSSFNFQLATLGLPVAACLGATLVLLLVLAVSRRVTSNVSLLIVGMMFGSIAGALVSLLQNFANPDALKLFIVWTLGSLSSVGWEDMQLMLPVLILGSVFVLLSLKPLNGLLLGEDYARGLGIHVARTRLYIVLATGLLAGGVTAFCGPVAFIGVAVPHIARGIFRTSNHRVTIPASAVIGACLLLVCDVLCSLFIYPLPISTVSALFGAPVIIWIILKNNR